MLQPTESFNGISCTICSTYDCNLRCKYDLPAGTKVLMADFSEKNIEDVKPGDTIIAFDEKTVAHKFRKFKYATVEAAGPTRVLDEAYNYILYDGSVALTASGEHPVVNQRNAFQKTEDFYNSSEKDKRIYRDHLPRNLKLEFSTNYKIGYLIASWIGDGEIRYALNKIANENSFNHGARFVVKDVEIMDRMRKFMDDLGLEYSGYPFKISEKDNLTVNCIYMRGTMVDKFDREFIKKYFGNCDDIEYLKGFFAGAFDCEGSCDGIYNSYSIANSDDAYVSTLCDCLNACGFENRYVIKEASVDNCVNVILMILKIARRDAVRMITMTNPACLRKYSEGIEYHGYYDRIPVKIEKVKIKPTQFYNLTTTARTFIANGIYVHNCYELNKRAVRIDEKTMFKFIDRILEDPDPIGAAGTSDAWISNVGCILDFIGGDSFMQPDLMDKALSYFQYKANKLNHPYAKNWRASISTNGTLFADPAVQALIEKYGDNLSIGVSIDGCPEMHDANRIFTVRGKNGEELGTMSTIMKWWPWLRERQPDATNHTKSTCNKDSIPWLYKSLVFMHTPYPEGLGITYVNQNFIMEDTGCQEDDYVLLDEMFRKCSKYLWDHRHEMYWSMFDKMGLIHRSDNVADFKHSIKKGWCGSGAMPSLGMNGKMYPCFRWLPHTMESTTDDADTMCVGNVEEGFIHKENFRKVKEASREKISSQYCLECEYEGACAYCIGGCYSENHAFKRTEHICYIAKIRSKWAHRYWDMLEEEEHNRDDYFSDTMGASYTMRENDYVGSRDPEMRWGNDGRIKPEFRTPDNPTGEAPLKIPDLPPEYRDAWKYRPKKVIKEGDEMYCKDDDSLPVDNNGNVTVH